MAKSYHIRPINTLRQTQSLLFLLLPDQILTLTLDEEADYGGRDGRANGAVDGGDYEAKDGWWLTAATTSSTESKFHFWLHLLL